MGVGGVFSLVREGQLGSRKGGVGCAGWKLIGNFEKGPIFGHGEGVLPDGTVGRVVLLVRGESSLEVAAIHNLKRWKFNSLPLGTRISDQWGTTRFRFLGPRPGPSPRLSERPHVAVGPDTPQQIGTGLDTMVK
jgi:hypothetical protein